MIVKTKAMTCDIAKLWVTNYGLQILRKFPNLPNFTNQVEFRKNSNVTPSNGCQALFLLLIYNVE